jgi:predicted DNA-binding helix-hairpin-helix protein
MFYPFLVSMNIKKPIQDMLSNLASKKKERHGIKNKIRTFRDDFDTLDMNRKEKILRVVKYVLYDE